MDSDNVETSTPARAESDRVALPFWARALDTGALALLVLCVLVALFGGIRVRPFGVRLSFTSPPRLLGWAAALLLIRHLIVRERPLYERLLAALARARRSAALRASWPAFLGTRFPVLLAGYFAVVIIGYPPNAPPWRNSENEIWNLTAKWDTGWYMLIATEGYRWSPGNQQQNIVFFPAYPMLMRVVGRLLGGRTLLAGTMISLVAFVLALVYLYRLAREQLDEPASAAALMLLAAYPFALYFSAAYTESLFLLGAVGAFYHFRQNELAKAGAWGLLVGLSRPNGCFLALPLVLLALERRWLARSASGDTASRDVRLPAEFAAAAMPVVGMLVYSAFVYMLTGYPFQWARGHAAWGRTYRGMESLVLDRYEFISQYGLYQYTATLPIDLMHGAAALFALVAIWPVARRFGLGYAAFIAVNLIPPLFLGGLLSVGRVTSVLFPVFLWLATMLPARHRSAWTAAFAVGQGLNAALFFTWRPLY